MNLRDLFVTPPPEVALAIDAGRVAGARLAWRGAAPVVAAHAVETLPEGAVVPALAALNLPDVGVVAAAVGRVLGTLGRPRRVALVVPDAVGKVSLVRFEQVPAKDADLAALVRWQIKKSAPFPIDEAVVSFTEGAAAADGGREFVVTAARADIIAQYEEACRAAGAHAGLVDLATCSVINGVLAAPGAATGDWLLVHLTRASTTLAVVRDGHLIFFRNRAEDAEGTLADLVHQTAMYYEDRLAGHGFGRVLLAGAAVVPGGGDALRKNLEERLGLGVEAVDPRATVSLADRIGASPALLDTLAPLVGLLLRERKAA
ncbi:MAG: type IV pilus biogenesis protein PilM [Vicinamibacterales bacterium]